MTILNIHLNKLLRLMYAPERLRRKVLLEDIRRDEGRSDGGGGDFYAPFWADARTHALGEGDLELLTTSRIAANKRRERLYPALSSGFLTWWNERRRWRNEPLTILPAPAKARLQLPSLTAVVKVEGIMGLDSGPDFERLIYPYFAEEPTLVLEAAGLGLWAMRAALPAKYSADDMRILDVFRGTSYGSVDAPFTGREEELFMSGYGGVIDHWKRLKAAR